MQKAQQHRERAGFALRMIRDFFIGNWRAEKGWVFYGCKKLAFCKTLAITDFVASLPTTHGEVTVRGEERTSQTSIDWRVQ